MATYVMEDYRLEVGGEFYDVKLSKSGVCRFTTTVFRVGGERAVSTHTLLHHALRAVHRHVRELSP